MIFIDYNMKFKCVLMASLILAILMVGAVSAADTTFQDIIPDADDGSLEIDQDSYGVSENSFINLAEEIESAGTVLDLNHDYAFNNETDNKSGIAIVKDNFVLNGNGRTINGNNQSRIFNITANNVTLCNLVLTGGNAKEGGAIYSTGALTLKNVTFIANYATEYGGAVLFETNLTLNCNNTRFIDNYGGKSSSLYVERGNVTLYNSYITSKVFSKRGQMVFQNSRVHVENTTFINISASYTPAFLAINFKEFYIINSKFINLRANTSAGALCVKNGGDVYIKDCEFINTSSSKNAGAILADIAGTSNTEGSVTIVDTIFKDTYSEFGGAYLQLGGNLLLDNTEFTNGHAVYNGGSVYLSWVQAVINNCTFASNGVEIFEGYPTYGGAIFSDISILIIDNSRFINNTAGAGSAVYAYDTSYCIANSLFENNTNPIYTFFDGQSILEDNIYINDGNISTDNEFYVSIVDGQGMQLTLINSTANVTDIPSSFDLRDYGWVTPVRNQGWMGACWTFSMTAALESSLLKATGISADFSENNMQNTMMRYSIYGIPGLSEGGLNIAGSSYLLSWLGAFPQDADTYDELGKISPVITTPYDVHVQDVMLVPNDEIPNGTQMKLAIMKYGALDVGYFDQSSHDEKSLYFNSKTYAQYINVTKDVDHEASVVGWDDNFPKEKFLITPPGDGAWIIKNSRGDDWGDGGYMYVSYYDKSFTRSTEISNYATAILFENTEPYNKNYQYDISWSGYFLSSGRNNVSYCNLFEALDDDYIAAVGTYFNQSGISYEVEIYVNDELKLTQEGVSPYYGYHTIKLNEYIPVKKGDIFKAVVTSNAMPCLFFFDSRIYYTENISFACLDGVTWEDCYYEDAIACLKVYTIDETKHNTSLVAAYDDEKGVLTATLTDEEGNAIEGADVGFKVGDDTYAAKTDSEGQVVLLTEDFAPGTYSAAIYYEGDFGYCPSEATCDFTVKADIAFDAVHDVGADELIVTFTNNATGKPVSGAYLSVQIEDENATVKTNSKGQVKVSTADLPYGEYTATFSYAGNAKYNPLLASIDFNTKDEIDISAVYDAEKNEIIATLINNATGKYVSNAKVNVNLNGEDYTVKTNSKGQIKVLTADLPLGKYTATISYAGNSKYNPASTSIDVDVKTKVIVTDIYGDSDKLVASLTNGETGNPIANANMVVEINGVSTTVKSNSKGKISVDTSDLGLDSYDVTISYPGNSKYNPSSATAAIDLNKANMLITYVYDAESQELTATLKNSKTGKAVSNANMVVDINGIESTYKADNKGQIILSTIDWAPGTHVGTISYDGNSKYNSISAAFKVDV